MVGVSLAGLRLQRAGFESNIRLSDQHQAQQPLFLPRRIVTLTPALGELVADLLSVNLDRIVGVSEGSDFPPQLLKKPSVGPFPKVNLEQVAALAPDLVLASQDGNSRDQVAHLRELGLRVEVIVTGSFQDIAQSFEQVGEWVGEERAGKQLAEGFLRDLEGVRIRNASRPGPKQKVLLQLGDHPLVVVGSRCFLDAILQLLQVENVFGQASLSYPRPSLEEVLALDPETVVVLGMGEESGLNRRQASKVSQEVAARRWASSWQRWSQLRAVRQHRIFFLSSDALLRPTLRLLEGLQDLERVFYESQRG